MFKFSLFIFVICFFSVFVSCSEKKETIFETDVLENADHDLIENTDNLTDEDSEVSDNSVIPENFEKGPYGVIFGDTAGDFTLPLEEGNWIFSQNRSSLENYIFIFYRPSNSESTAIWKTDLIKLFENSPENTHYFFLVDGTKETFDIKIGDIKETIKSSFEIGGTPSIKKRIHITTKPAKEINSWFSEWLNKYSDFFLGIDSFQKIRKSGSFHSWQSSSLDPKFDFVYKEAELYNYESSLRSFLDENNSRTTVLKAVEGLPFQGDGWTKDLYFTVDFPDFSNISGNLFVNLAQLCEDPKTCEWDRIQQLFLCSDENVESCNIEIARWITTYGRSGKWLTDISPLLPLFEKAGKYKFRFTVSGDQYTNYLDFLYIQDKSAVQHKKIIPLFSGTVPFDENYNNYWKKINIEISDIYTKFMISSFITGHGNGSEMENCAEFCKFESVFYVNDKPYSTHFKNAGTDKGCYELVSKGTVPNQYGSWPFGRAGWCPGQDVKLINIDITEAVKKGSTNQFFYNAFLDGKTYIPEVTDSSGYRAEIPITSYLIMW